MALVSCNVIPQACEASLLHMGELISVCLMKAVSIESKEMRTILMHIQRCSCPDSTVLLPLVKSLNKPPLLLSLWMIDGRDSIGGLGLENSTNNVICNLSLVQVLHAILNTYKIPGSKREFSQAANEIRTYGAPHKKVPDILVNLNIRKNLQSCAMDLAAIVCSHDLWRWEVEAVQAHRQATQHLLSLCLHLAVAQLLEKTETISKLPGPQCKDEIWQTAYPGDRLRLLIDDQNETAEMRLDMCFVLVHEGSLICAVEHSVNRDGDSWVSVGCQCEQPYSHQTMRML